MKTAQEKNYQIFNREGIYVLFDPNTMVFYHLPEEFGKELSENTEEALMKKSAINEYLYKQKQAIIRYPGNHNKCKRLVLVISQQCNLACKYCYAQGGDYGEIIHPFMEESMAISAINFFTLFFQKELTLYKSTALPGRECSPAGLQRADCRKQPSWPG